MQVNSLNEYKGIKKSSHPKWEGWYWISEYCHNKDNAILENDIVLQNMVKRHHKKQLTKYISLTFAIWFALGFMAYELVKG